MSGARSLADRARLVGMPHQPFGRVPVDDRAYDCAWQVREALTRRVPGPWTRPSRR